MDFDRSEPATKRTVHHLCNRWLAPAMEPSQTGFRVQGRRELRPNQYTPNEEEKAKRDQLGLMRTHQRRTKGRSVNSKQSIA